LPDDVHDASRKFYSELKFGRPIEASQGLARMLGVTEMHVNDALAEGVPAIEKEMKSVDEAMRADIERAKLHGQALAGRYSTLQEKDGRDWSDWQWLHYFLYERARKDPLDPKKMPDDYVDKGNEGLLLDDFVRKPQATDAGLSAANVLALRLYSSSVFKNINNPLVRDQRANSVAEYSRRC
jgi:hypothetical protein